MSRITALILAALAFFTSILGFGAAKKRQGVKQERSETKKRQAVAANEANERMNHADTSNGDASADVDWLRERGKRNSDS